MEYKTAKINKSKSFFELKHRGEAVLRNTCANQILVNKSIKHNWLLKGPRYYEYYL